MPQHGTRRRDGHLDNQEKELRRVRGGNGSKRPLVEDKGSNGRVVKGQTVSRAYEARKSGIRRSGSSGKSRPRSAAHVMVPGYMEVYCTYIYKLHAQRTVGCRVLVPMHHDQGTLIMGNREILDVGYIRRSAVSDTSTYYGVQQSMKSIRSLNGVMEVSDSGVAFINP